MIDQRIASSLDPSRDILTRSWANATAPRETKDHPAIKLLDDLTTLSAAEIELQKKTEILNNLKVELIQLLQNQREKDLRYVEMEETLDKAELNRSLEDHLQLKVEKVSKDLKTSKKRCGELSSEVAQANMRIRGLHEELKSEKDKNKLSAEHVAMLKDSLEEKQTSVVELKRMLDAERMAVMEMRQRMSLLQKSLEEEKSSAAAAQQEKTRQRDHSVVQVERKLQSQIKELEEKVMLSKASETAVTARVRSLEKELSEVHSEAVSIAKPWMSHHPLPSQYSAVACVHELKGRCELLRRNEEKLSQQLAATESKFQQSTDSLEGVTDVLSRATKESNSSCEDLLHTLFEVVEKLTTCQTPVPHHSSTCSSSSSSTDSSEEEGDGENQHVEPVEQDCTFLLKRCIAQLISTAKNHLQEIHAAHHQLCQVVNGNCEAVGITGTNSEQMVEVVFSELKAAQDRIKELNDK
jgi:chromosome segregation ATPase